MMRWAASPVSGWPCPFFTLTNPVDEAAGTTRTLRGLMQQLGQTCPTT